MVQSDMLHGRSDIQQVKLYSWLLLTLHKIQSEFIFTLSFFPPKFWYRIDF